MKIPIIVVALMLPLCAAAETVRVEFNTEYPEEVTRAYGHYYQEDFETAFAEFSVLAELGDPFSQFILGWMHQEGEATPVNQQEAIKWYRKSADGGFSAAMFNLGGIYENGNGVPQDNEEALRWYGLAAVNGDPDAQSAYNSLRSKMAALRDKESESLSQTSASAAPAAPNSSGKPSNVSAQSRVAPKKEIVASETASPVKVQPSVNPPRTASTYRAASANRSSSSGLDRIAFKGLQGATVGVTLALIGGLVALIIWGAKKTTKAAAPKVEHLRKTAIPKAKKLATKSSSRIRDFSKTEEEKVLEIDDSHFETASDEILTNSQKSGLWLKAQTLADGDEVRQKAIYIRLRAKQLDEAKDGG
jgi:hypothetical protein